MEDPSKKARKGGQEWTPSSSSSSSSSLAAITDLPSHILMEILFRLPIKTLMATKSVCKSWLHLIKDPHFAKLHHARAKVETYLQFKVDYNVKEKINIAYMGNFGSSNKSLDHPLTKVNILPELPAFSDTINLRFINSCNGLLSYSCYERPNNSVLIRINSVLIWNPITSEFFTVPVPKTCQGLQTYDTYGFGFSQKANRFKLLCITRDDYNSDIVAEICTIEKGCSWRTISSSFPYSGWTAPRYHNFDTFLQGCLHWISEKDCQSSRMGIASFDFEEEKYGEVPLPPHFKTMNNSRIGVLSGCLFVTETIDQSLNIWLMNEYGVKDSWARVISLEFTHPSQIYRYGLCSSPLCYLDNGELLLHKESCFLCTYDLVLERIIATVYNSILAYVIAFSPSLIPLKDYMMTY